MVQGDCERKRKRKKEIKGDQLTVRVHTSTHADRQRQTRILNVVMMYVYFAERERERETYASTLCREEPCGDWAVDCSQLLSVCRSVAWLGRLCCAPVEDRSKKWEIAADVQGDRHVQ